MDQKTILIWGAGAIGRGFVADLFQAEGYELVLVDQSLTLVEQLRSTGGYPVVRAKNEQERDEVKIQEYRAYHTAEIEALQAEINQCDLMAIAVYAYVFDTVAQQLVPMLLQRMEVRPNSPFDVMLCVNLSHAGEKFTHALRKACPAEKVEQLLANTGIVETLVIRICPQVQVDLRQKEPLLVLTNGYPTLHVERKAFKGEIPNMPSLRLVEDMRAEETRKIYTYNMAQAALAYHGALRGYERIVDCIDDEKVHAEAEGALGEVSLALTAAYGFTPEDMADWNHGVMEQTANPALGDTVQRMGADPIRKLRRDDRLAGAALLCLQYGIQPTYLMRALAAALHYQHAQDQAAQQVKGLIAKQGVREAVKELCALKDEEHELLEDIVRAYHRLPLEIHWQKMAKQAYQLGFEYEKKYHGCGQCVFATIEDVLARDDASVFNAATGLSGGLGLYGKVTCSALTGSVLAIGLLYPRTREQFDGARENKYTTFCLTQRLVDKFVQKYASCICHDIHTVRMGRAFDLRSKAEREAFEEAGAHNYECTDTVALAAQWTIEIIGEQMVEEALKVMV